MAHIHEKIDFTVSIFVVQDGKILLIHHRNLNKWLPLGGHVELDEDPEKIEADMGDVLGDFMGGPDEEGGMGGGGPYSHDSGLYDY